jgi:hypothetical protein
MVALNTFYPEYTRDHLRENIEYKLLGTVNWLPAGASFQVSRLHV